MYSFRIISLVKSYLISVLYRPKGSLFLISWYPYRSGLSRPYLITALLALPGTRARDVAEGGVWSARGVSRWSSRSWTIGCGGGGASHGGGLLRSQLAQSKVYFIPSNDSRTCCVMACVLCDLRCSCFFCMYLLYSLLL